MIIATEVNHKRWLPFICNFFGSHILNACDSVPIKNNCTSAVQTILKPREVIPCEPIVVDPTVFVSMGGMDIGARSRPIPVWANSLAIPKKIVIERKRKIILQPKAKPDA